ncbi:uncharacterized protein M421DRAFT_388187 [Didymella exigua CBS 183.55]|uniref:Rhodopsin domain-containing protein n=1 Tax=Didymella exigua CBS 183.55 TaxID=1150837 RepID=A0A6A5RZJ2_9PLEO|nr:uncharacterized protein M421DRAFT_388187 [Didymella exigua CBS 183.55]KAF1933885.1 hypothetical protein M421DRAFT_388187 [Didymella exigua CBS 183.55]
MDQLTKYMALSILNIIIDVFTLVLPITVTERFQMPRIQKISVCAIFATGSFVCAVAIRLTTLLEPLMISKDYTWDAVEQFEWCFAEVNAAIICACAPAPKLFFARYLPGLLGSHFRSHNSENEPSNNSEPNVPATTGSNSYNRDQSAKNVYDMQWRDDLSDEILMSKRGGKDDEARLWKVTNVVESTSPPGFWFEAFDSQAPAEGIQ